MTSGETSERLVAPNLSTLAYERLEKAIMEGDIKPGERLSESALARRYGISRGPLREAIGQLEGRRLVERVSHLGARVVSLSDDDLLELMTIREALEGMACRLAATRMTPDQLARIEALLAGHAEDEDIRSDRGYFQAPGEGDFHQIILDNCGNARLQAMLDGELYSLLRLYRHRFSMRPGRPAAALKEHRAILAALKQGDADKAEAAMRAHIRASRAAVEAGG